MADTDDKGTDGVDKQFRIIVEGVPRVVLSDELTFDEVVDLAYPDGGRGPQISYTVTFENGGGRPVEGTLVDGEKVKVKDGTEFSVTRTDRS